MPFMQALAGDAVAAAWVRAAQASETEDNSPADCSVSSAVTVCMKDVEAAMKRFKARQGKDLGTPQARVFKVFVYNSFCI